MRTISIPKGAKLVSSGSFGSYYRLSPRRGMKVIWHTKINIAKKEAFYLNKAASIGLAPRCREIVKIESDLVRSNYGLIVDHIDGKPTSWSIKRSPTKNSEMLREKLAKVGIVNNDLYGNNVRKIKKGYMVVDFTPCQCSYKK